MVDKKTDYAIEAMKWVSPIESTLSDENHIKGIDAAFSYIKVNYTKRNRFFGASCFLMGMAFLITLNVVISIILGG